jgi:uncharacterized protein YjdB
MKTRALLTLVCGFLFFCANAQFTPVFTGGTSQNLAMCQNSGTQSLSSQMVVNDLDLGQTLSYTIVSAPTHGTVFNFPGTTTTNGGNVSPVGFGYAPTAGYNGTDVFIVRVSDGTLSSQTSINITINPLPVVAAITGTASACIGNTSQLACTTINGVWSSSNVFVADVASNGLVTAQAAGTATISYTVTNATTGCTKASTVVFSVAGQPVVQPITGTTTLCVGATTTLASATAGGVWTSSNNANATVVGGVVTGVNGGNANIIYTVTNGVGCSTAVSAGVTINNSPNVNAINAATTTICIGSTTNITSTSNGGTWTTNDPAIATVTPIGGGGGGSTARVTGVGNGVATISYTITNGAGCSTARTVDITVATPPTVAAITGTNTVCVGSTTQLASATSGGTWTINNANATISNTGLVTGVNQGNSTVSYSVLGASGCTRTVTYPITINSVPTVNPITGSNFVCIGSSITLTSSTGGGTWTSSLPSVATISAAGVANGLAAGTTVITYTVTNASGCTRSVTFNLTASTSVTVQPITGGSSICTGSTLQLACATTGGTWTTSDIAVAAVTATGSVVPITAGVVNICYTVGSGACSGQSCKNVIVYASPTVGPIVGTSAICLGTTSQLTNSASGGNWTSSNVTVATVNSTGLVNPLIAGNSVITYSVTSLSGCTRSATLNITVNTVPIVAPITGTDAVCIGATTQLNSLTTSGTWATSDATIADIASSAGSCTVIGISAGTVVISYSVTNGNGCTTTRFDTVLVSANLAIDPIVGSPLCLGALPNPLFTCGTPGGVWSTSNASVASVSTGGTVTPQSVGSVTVIYTVDNGGGCIAISNLNTTVNARPNQPLVTGADSVCVGDSTQLIGNPSAGVWAAVITGGPQLISVNSSTGFVKGLLSPGGGGFPSNVTYTITNATTGCSRTSANKAITVKAGPAINNTTGPNTVCAGKTITKVNTTPGGTWSSNNTNIATVNSTTGVVTGVANGNAIINYSVSSAGCNSVSNSFVTVNASPVVNPTTGVSTACVGVSTQLSNATVGGVWSSSNTAVATVSNSGVVLGISAGTSTISYTVTTGGGGGGCSTAATTIFTVNALPTVNPITGTVSSICAGATTQLNTTSVGGTWSVNKPLLASISATGLVTGIAGGNIIATYTITTSGCNATAFYNLTINPLPVVPAITGNTSVCLGSNSQLSNTTAAGVWSSSATSIATVDATGLVIPIAIGNSTISYTVTSAAGCIKTVTANVTVSAVPVVAAITGATAVCANATTTLSCVTASGVWSSDNTSAATVDNAGIVSGVAPGVAVISYTVTNAAGCITIVTKSITINPIPAVAAITGTTSLCEAITSQLANATASGVWQSATPTVATINSTGLVTGVLAGTSIVTYTVSNSFGCNNAANVTININAIPVIAPITGTQTVCVGSTRTYSSTTAGGTWSSSNTSVAFVTASGVISGVAAGTATISYTVSNGTGCSSTATRNITVNALPIVAASAGATSVCLGSAITLTNATASGVWSSSNTSIATVSAAGLVTPVSAGVVNILYSVSDVNSCVAIATKSITVNSLPTVAAITGTTNICLGAMSTLSNTTLGGTWTSSNTSVATITSTTGVVNALMAGTSSITYTFTNGNGCTSSSSTTITIVPLPAVSFTINNNSQCVNTNSFVFTNTTTYAGGTSASSNNWSFGDASTSIVTSPTKVYATAGIYNVKLVAANNLGCKDSVIQIVTVKAISTSVTNVSRCPSQMPYLWNGINRAAAGTFTFVTTNSQGCDSTATLNLTVKTNTTSTTNTSICPSQLPYSWNGSRAAAGTYTFVTTNSQGCDSTATLNLTVKTNTTSTTNTSICPSQLPYSWNGSRAAAGTYTFVTSNSQGCDSTATLNLTVKTNSTSTSNVSICQNSLPYSWNGSRAAAGTYTFVTTNSQGCDSTATLNLTVKTNTTSITNVSICPSALPYSWNGSRSTAGTYTFVTTNSQGCDSTATLNLVVKTNTTTTTNVSICPSALPYSWNGSRAAAGTYTFVTTNSQGCDSTATLNLTVKTNTTSTTNTSICPSQLPYSWNGSRAAAGTYTFVTTNSQGCDSTATLNLTVKTNTTSTTNVSICPAALPYSWNGSRASAGTYTFVTTNSQGCDSTATLNLTVKTNTTSTTNVSICPVALPYSWNGSRSAAGTYTFVTTNSQGCDSTATLNLVVKTNTTSTTNVSICPAALPYIWNGSRSAAGTYTFVTTNSQGCDSTATLNLVVKTNTTSTTNSSICPSQLPYNWNGSRSVAGTYTFVTTNSQGCDSTATLNLVVKTNSTSTHSHTACNTYTWNGTTYTTSGVYTFTTLNSVGCDSVATLNLTINNSSTSSHSHTACNTYSWNGSTYTTSGVYTFTTTNSVGCDSVATLNLTINNSSTSTHSHTACNTYSWNGSTYTTSGVYTFTTTNSVGCDSVATLNLIINNSSTSTHSHTACNTYTWNGTAYTTSGVYTFTTTNAVGCDSVATLNLTINNSSTSSHSHTACNTYTWNGSTYTTSGVYTFTTTNSVGCDSVATLNLTINNSSTSSHSHTACNTYAWNGSTYTTSGVYTFTTLNSKGCDSVATLNLIINNSSTSTHSHTACNTYTWNGSTYTTSGVYTFTTLNSKGCDSVATLNLTINNSSTSSHSHTACNSYTWNGSTYTTSGVYTFTTTNAVGCDSVATLNLTINNSSTSTHSHTACNTYTWNGSTYTTSGVYTFTTTNSVGCDSVATLNLTINANPIVAIINGTPKVCIGNTTPLSNTTAGGVWASLDNSVATIDASGLVSGISTGTAVITYTVTNASSCSSIASLNVMVKSLPTVASIMGSNQVCIGSTTTLTNDTLGGVWSSLTPATATITNAGVVTGVSVGGTTIKYTITDVNGCATTVNKIITVNALPIVATITGTNMVCVSATTTLANATASGVWSSANTAIATIDASGVVSGVSAGVAIINYMVTNATTGCNNATSTSVTVNALPVLGSINGSSSICVNSTTTLSNTTIGGTWSSSNAAIATIDNAGMVTAIAAGTTTIKYMVSNGSGCIDSASKTITINDNPSVASITAAPNMCAGSTITASNIVAGGVWAIGNTALATIDASGIITGIAAGNTTISYTVTDAATTCSSTILAPLAVNTPAVAPITGVNALCSASTTTLNTTTMGGMWSSTNPSVATVDMNSGLVTAIANGTTTISYKVPVGNACGDSASTIVTVNATLSIAPITGDTTVCLGTNSMVTSVTLGGTWASSNPAVATINTTTGAVVSVTAGTSTLTYSVTSGAGCSSSLTTTFTVDALPTTPSFTMATSACVGANVTLVPSVATGVWSSSNASIASVDAAGNLSAVSVGNADITYTVTNAAGCMAFVTKSITINALPVIAAITGSNTLCVGSSITLANDSVGGVWSSNNASVLNIDANSGVVTSAIAGTAIFSYTIINAAGCAAIVSKSVTAFDIPTVATISGGNSVCVGSTITLSSATPNGVWSSLTTSVASIDNAGLLTGNAAGGTTIKYTVTDATTTCVNNASLIVTVNALPIVPAITGASAVCLNKTTTLSNSTLGGMWISSNTSVATIDNSGIVTGVGAGTATITYSVTNASNCTATATSNITVNVASTSNTPISVCINMLPYNWNGTNYTSAGTYSFTTSNALGCDSIATLVLTIKDTTTSSTTTTACGSFAWNGTTYTTSGTYSWRGTNAAGCDSVATLVLTIVSNPSVTITGGAAVCGNSAATQLTSTVVPNNGGVSYLWRSLAFNENDWQVTGIDSFLNVNVSLPTQYQLMVTIAGCGTFISNQQGVTPVKSPDVTLAPTPVVSICNNNVVNFTASTTDLENLNYAFYQGSNLLQNDTTRNYTTSILTTANSGQLYTVQANYNKPVFNGNIDENFWGIQLASSLSGAAPSFGAGHELNALYTRADSNNVYFAIAGNVQDQNRIMLFIDSKAGGYNNGNYGRTGLGNNAIKNFNSATTFDVGFTADYVLGIGTDNTRSKFYFDLFTLGGTASGGGGTNNYLGTNLSPTSGYQLGASPINQSQTRGFEIAIPKSAIGYTGGDIQVMAMYSADNGFLSNQFLTRANLGAGNYGNGAVVFAAATPNPIAISIDNMLSACKTVSATTTVVVKPNLTSTTTIQNCDSLRWNGTKYTTSGVYTFTTLGSNGCDSIATLNLTITQPTNSSTNQTVCDSVSWNGTTYTTSGTYMYHTTNAAGCDSMATLILTVNATPATPTITTSTANVAVPATAIAYSCSTVATATSYTWSYTGTNVTIASGQGTTSITADFAANATNGNMQVVANNATCSSIAATVTLLLPTTLSNFTATKVNNTAVLKWNSKLEINAKEYQVQKSIDGKNFENIGIVAAKGVASEYSFVDEKLFAGINYYRLKQVDVNGKFEYSTIKQLLVINAQLAITIYPNPTSETLNVTIKNAEAKQIRIYNSLGKTVFTSNVVNNTNKIKVGNLSSGTYFVEIITTDGRREVEKFIKD